MEAKDAFRKQKRHNIKLKRSALYKYVCDLYEQNNKLFCGKNQNLEKKPQNNKFDKPKEEYEKIDALKRKPKEKNSSFEIRQSTCK